MDNLEQSKTKCELERNVILTEEELSPILKDSKSSTNTDFSMILLKEFEQFRSFLEEPEIAHPKKRKSQDENINDNEEAFDSTLMFHLGINDVDV